MENPARKINPLLAQLHTRQASNATTLAKTLGPKSFEYIKPPIDLRDKSKPIRKPNFNPIENAEKQLKLVSSGFRICILKDIEKLRLAHKKFADEPANHQSFEALNACIHTIKGNASILGYDAAGMLATPLASLMEGCSDHEKADPILHLAINAICQSVEFNTPANDPALSETITMLNQLNSSCIAQKSRTNKPDYAAGSASCGS